MTDPATGETEAVFKRMASLTENALEGSSGAQKQMELTYRVDGSEYLDKTLAESEQPPMTIIEQETVKNRFILRLW